METQQETATLDLARIGYEAYRQHTGGISLATGQKLPSFDELNDQVRGAWIAAGSTIGMAVVEELKRTAAKSGGKATVRLAGDFSAVLEAEDPKPERLTPPPQKPSVGRIVMYRSLDRNGNVKIFPAIITEVDREGNRVRLVPFGLDLSSVFFAHHGNEEMQWSWPERV